MTAPAAPTGGSQLRADRTRAPSSTRRCRCILEEGFAAASAKHITERAGVTWGVVQYHFGDRDGLLMAVVDQGFAELLESLRDLPAAPRTPRPNGIRGPRGLGGVLQPDVDGRAGDPHRAPVHARHRATQHLAELANAFAELGRHIGEGLAVRHATAIGNLIWATLRGLVVSQLVVAEPLDSKHERHALVDMISAYVEGATTAGAGARLGTI